MRVDSHSRHTLIHGDCIEAMRLMPDNSVDAVVTDPPYGLGFMGKKWDALPPGLDFAREAFRVLKPGGHIIAFGGQRTIHRLTCALEDGGLEIRDLIGWAFWSGFPKSLNVSKAIDKAAGSAGVSHYTGANNKNKVFGAGMGGGQTTAPYESATPEAAQWEGWGTALKPCIEPAILARKPLAGTVAANVLEWGTGALNIDGCRYGYGDSAWPGPGGVNESKPVINGGAIPRTAYGSFASDAGVAMTFGTSHDLGRWPANIYYCPKASRREREAGLNAGNMVCSCKPRSEAWASADQSQNTTSGKAASAGLDTTESNATADSSWPTDGSGSRSTAQSPTATTSTTSTATGSTTTSPTCNSLTGSPTSESTAGANSETASGGSRAAGAASSSESGPMIGTSAKRGGPSTAGVAPATSGSSSSQSERGVCGRCGRWTMPPTGERFGIHPTTKPIALMRWLVRLITPPGGVVLEPFAGSGTTMVAAELEGFRCIGIELEADYLPIIQGRLEHAIRHGERGFEPKPANPDNVLPGQTSLFGSK